MDLTNFPNGISSQGVPVLPPMGPVTTGSVFFVCNATNANGSDGNAGTSPDKPFSTVDYAIGRCAAGKGDVIYVMPGHAETVTATSIALDVAGVQVIGLGTGLSRPAFTFGAAAATITVTGANTSWRNTLCIANFLNVAAAFSVAAKDVVIDGNTFLDTSAILNFLSAVVTGSTNNEADGLTVTNSYFLGAATTQNAFVSILANEKRLLLADNHVDMAATNDAGHFVTLSSKILSGAQILRNRLSVVGATSAAVGIFLTGSGTTSTGMVAYNLVASLDTTSELIATAGTGLTYFENYYTGTADASGKLWPAVDAA
jgi:hypothetical protein